MSFITGTRTTMFAACAAAALLAIAIPSVAPAIAATAAARAEEPSADKARATAQIRAAVARSNGNRAFIAAKKNGDMATIAKILTANGAPKGIVVENGGGDAAGSIIIRIKCKCWGGDFDIDIRI